MRQSGLITRIGKTYLKPIDKCLAREAGHKPNKISQLTLSDLADVFTMIFGLGCLLSALAFLLEMLMSSIGFRVANGAEPGIIII